MGNGAAVCHEFVGPKGQILIIAIDMEQAQGKSKEQIAAIIAHEAVHASQFLLNEIGEHKPGVETPAYIVGYLTQRCLQELWRD